MSHRLIVLPDDTADAIIGPINQAQHALNIRMFLFTDRSLAWVHIDARHDYASVSADIAAWEPKVCGGGWLSGDDFNADWWPGVVGAVHDCLPGAAAWWSTQWRWIKDR